MENNTTMELEDGAKSSLPNVLIALTFFFLISSLINYVYFKDIFLVSEGRPEDFNFRNFLIYNLGVKWILYPFKFAALIGIMMMGAFLFKVEKLSISNTLKVVLLAELVKYLPELLRIVWFTFFDFESLEGYDMHTFNDNLSLNGLLGLTRQHAMYSLFNYLSIPQVLYVLAVAYLLKQTSNQSFSFHLYWFGLTYGVVVLLLSLISILISL